MTRDAKAEAKECPFFLLSNVPAYLSRKVCGQLGRLCSVARGQKAMRPIGTRVIAAQTADHGVGYRSHANESERLAVGAGRPLTVLTQRPLEVLAV